MVGERRPEHQQRGVMDGPCAPAPVMLVLVPVLALFEEMPPDQQGQPHPRGKACV
jgi:hypothetical protein